MIGISYARGKILLNSSIIALPRFQGKALGFHLNDDGSVAKQDKVVYFACGGSSVFPNDYVTVTSLCRCWLWLCWLCCAPGRKNLPCAKFLSAYRKSGICPLSRCAGAGTASNIFSIGLNGEDGINSSLRSSTIEDKTPCSLLLSYNCSTRICLKTPGGIEEGICTDRFLRLSWAHVSERFDRFSVG